MIHIFDSQIVEHHLNSKSSSSLMSVGDCHLSKGRLVMKMNVN